MEPETFGRWAMKVISDGSWKKRRSTLRRLRMLVRESYEALKALAPSSKLAKTVTAIRESVPPSAALVSPDTEERRGL